MILRYELITAELDCGEKRHAQHVMDELSKKLNFNVLEATAHPIGDCWIFKIDRDLKQEDLPKYLVDITSIVEESEAAKKAGKNLRLTIKPFDMKVSRMEVKCFRERVYCVKCNAELRFNGICLTSNTPWYPHVCDNCITSVNLKDVYPRLVYEEIGCEH